ncbi:ECF transporter S component [Lacticaseibacillus pabuli]|uniref:Riboflavin transporter n=1 Tax=Lacticaseibacillus pabuli TaxID=3025672 RepID=A0ABY7WN12_9LACO|nr:ECF transporter S component [Lacticaseibacillus sp. KACC 23028]WDF81597.1 ECF transporter S component [Lacticaseibacillus sp. KACC 23028]
MNSSKLHKLVGVAALAGLGFILMSFEVPIIPAFPFLKLDASDLVILIGVLLYGFSGGVEVAVIRSLLHFIVTGASVVNLIGDTTSVLASIAFAAPLAIMIRKNYDWKRAAIGLGIGIVALTVVMSVLNYLVIMPMYLAVFGLNLHMSTLRYVLIGVVPFNLIKGAVLTGLFLVLARMLSPWLAHRRAASGNN